jgi:hypothetical protein
MRTGIQYASRPRRRPRVAGKLVSSSDPLVSVMLDVMQARDTLEEAIRRLDKLRDAPKRGRR